MPFAEVTLYPWTSEVMAGPHFRQADHAIGGAFCDGAVTEKDQGRHYGAGGDKQHGVFVRVVGVGGVEDPLSA